MATLNNYILNNLENYNKELSETTIDIFIKYVNLMNEFIIECCENLYMKNINYNIYIIKKGVETLSHIFSILLLYTMNLELVYHHCQNSLFYYIEFISQISGENNFLQLTLKDSALFVYKKTIFEINNEYRKSIPDSTQEEKNILSTVDSYTYIYKNIALFTINHNGFKYENKVDYINMCCDSIEFISETLNKNKIKPNYIECVYLFVTLLDDKKLEIIDYFKLMDEFIKKIIFNKKKIDEKKIKNKIYDSEINNLINENELNKIVEYIFLD